MNSKTIIDTWRKFLRESTEENIVISAFQNTDPGYLEASVNQRNPGPAAAGSTFLSSITVDELIGAQWVPYAHPDIMSPAIGYKANIPGTLGIANIASIPPGQPVKFQPAHGGKAVVREGPKAGMVLAEVVTPIPQGEREVEHTTLILGPSREDPSKMTMWTFFPGDPTPKFPDITIEDIREKFGTTEDTAIGTVADAISMGYNFVKHVDTL
mgnify:CR=1 FL=1